MTVQELRQIAEQSGIQHAEFCLEQLTTQIGRDAAAPLWNELGRLVDEWHGGDPLGDWHGENV